MSEAGSKRIAQWRDSLDRACGFDSWGQVVEAVEEYEKLNKSITKVLTAGDQNFSESQQRFLNKLAIVVSMRAKAAQDLTGDLDSDSNVSVEQIRSLLPPLKELGTSSNSAPAFPFEIKRPINFSVKVPEKPAVVVPDDDEDDDGVQEAQNFKSGGSLLPRKVFPRGGTAVCVRVEKIKLKDTSQYLEPYITVSVKDAEGVDMCPSQDTPVASAKDEFIHFGQDVHLQLPLENIGKGCAVIFEFKHYKPKKQKTSTKCWCFMEPDELRPASALPLEIYNKPADYRRKKLHLLTEKQHYFYVSVSLVQD